MPRVHFTSHLNRHLSCDECEVPGDTVRAVLDGVFAANPKLRSYLLDDQGRLRQHVRIFINDKVVRDRARLSDPVRSTDAVHVFQALSGG